MTNTTDIQIIERLTRIEEKFDGFIERAAHANTRAEDHETRIRHLEGGSARLLGIGSVLAMVVGVAGSRLVELTFGH